jgi:hypothetical protein
MHSWGAGLAPIVLTCCPSGGSKEIQDNLPFEVAVHNREEDLEEEVNGIYQYRQQVQPRFA